MNIARSSHSQSSETTADKFPSRGFWRFVPWAARLVLLWPAAVLTLVGFQGVLEPAGFGLAEGISLHSAQGTAIARVAFGGFPLGCALFAWWCLSSRRRIVTGLVFISVVMTAVIAVRCVGIVADHALGRNLRLLVVEAVIVIASSLAVWLERRRSRLENSFQ